MTSVALLDVNVLVALFDRDHVHHEVAHDWFAGQRPHGWATCALTENGFCRVVSHPSYGLALRPGDAAARLRAFRDSGEHRFWPDDISVTDATLFDPARIRGHRQIIDLYLLGLAVRHGGSLATFDRGMPTAAVRGATRQSLALIAPADPE